MILMYHHVCPDESIPEQRNAIEGWQYNLSPHNFEFQLQFLRQRGFRFVSFTEYIAACELDRVDSQRLATVTFDDGWIDNYTHALPILERLDIPAMFFVVSGKIEGVDKERRMTPEQLADLCRRGMSVGAHTHTHPNLTAIPHDQLRDELVIPKRDLESMIDREVDALAYPGGRFNRQVVEVAKSAGYRAACCVISGGRNNHGSRYWLFREVFSDQMNSPRDRVRLNAIGKYYFRWKSRRRVQNALRGSQGVKH